jgi:hypothetical protein
VITDNRWRAVPSMAATWELGEIYTQSPGVGASLQANRVLSNYTDDAR